MQSCPRCGKELEVKHKGQNSFLACSGYPQCDFTQGLREQSDIEPENLGVECPQCQRELQLKSGRYGLFVGCSGYPDCDFVAEPDAEESASIACPECTAAGRNGVLKHRTSRRGSNFYACDQYPDCRFSVNLPPVAQTCPKCQFPLLLRKRQSGLDYLICAEKNCDYKSEPI